MGAWDPDTYESQNGCGGMIDFYLLMMPHLFVLFFVCFFGFLSFFYFLSTDTSQNQSRRTSTGRGSHGIAIGKTVVVFS